MATAVEPLQGVRSAIETTRGTAVTTMTKILYPSSIGMVQDVTTVIPEELWSTYIAARRAYPGIERVGLQMAGDVTFTDFPLLLNTTVAPLLTGTLSDTSAYTWAFPPLAATDTLKSLTIEYGTADLIGTVGWRIPGLVCNELSITWRKAGIGGDETGLSYAAAFMTAQGAAQITAFTGALSDRTLINAIGTSSVSYLNTTGSAHGTTADTKIREATLTINNGFAYKDGFDGTNHATAIVKTGKRTATLTFQRYFEDKTELDAYLAKTSRRFRMSTAGPLAGAATVYHAIHCSFTGVPTAHTPAWSDGFLMANITLTGLYDSALTAEYTMSVVNTDSSTLT